VDPDHIVFGSDFPFVPKAIVANEVATLQALTVLDEGAKQGSNRRHAIEPAGRSGDSVG
jgi:6-methylsalicylate decarboxylase